MFLRGVLLQHLNPPHLYSPLQGSTLTLVRGHPKHPAPLGRKLSTGFHGGEEEDCTSAVQETLGSSEGAIIAHTFQQTHGLPHPLSTLRNS